MEASGSVSKTRNAYFFLMLRWSRLVNSRMFTLVLLVKVLVKHSGIFETNLKGLLSGHFLSFPFVSVLYFSVNSFLATLNP